MATVDFVPIAEETLPANDTEVYTFLQIVMFLIEIKETLRTYFLHALQQLRSIIKTLQTKLTDEAIKNAKMELEIREEVSHEFSEQMTEIENIYRLVETLF